MQTKYEIKRLGELVTIKLEDEEGVESMMLTTDQLWAVKNLIQEFLLTDATKLVKE